MGQHVSGQTVAAGEGLVANGASCVLVDSVNSMHLKRYRKCQFDKFLTGNGSGVNLTLFFLSARVSKWGRIGTKTNKQTRLD